MPPYSPRRASSALPVEAFKWVSEVRSSPGLLMPVLAEGVKQGSNRDRRVEAGESREVKANSDADLRWVPPGFSATIYELRAEITGGGFDRVLVPRSSEGLGVRPGWGISKQRDCGNRRGEVRNARIWVVVSDTDLRWVPPGLTVTIDWGQWSFVDFIGGMKVLAAKMLEIFWGLIAVQGKAKVKPVRSSEGTKSRANDREVCNLFKTQYIQYPSYEAMCKNRSEDSAVEILDVEVFMFRDVACSKGLFPNVGLVWHYWGIFCIYNWSRVYHKIIVSNLIATTLFNLVSSVSKWARNGVICYGWVDVFLCGRDIRLFAARSCKAWSSAVHVRIIDLVLFRRLLFAVHHWLTMRLFSVNVNTVHFWARYGPVQYAGHVCSSLDFSCDSLDYYYSDHDFYVMMNVSFLEVIQDSRSLIRNHLSVCVPMGAVLVVEQIANASIDRSHTLAWCFIPFI